MSSNYTVMIIFGLIIQSFFENERVVIMNLSLKIYLGCIILIPFLIIAVIRGLALAPEEIHVVIYFLH